jgi:hypothetical protein
MENHVDWPLKIGDTVTYNTFGMGGAERATGVVLSGLGDGPWRVKWSNHEIPMTHRRHSLKRIGSDTSPSEA